MVTISIDESKSLNSDDSTVSKLNYFTCCMMIKF